MNPTLRTECCPNYKAALENTVIAGYYIQGVVTEAQLNRDENGDGDMLDNIGALAIQSNQAGNQLQEFVAPY